MIFKPNQGILSIEPYVGGESKVDGAGRVIKLSSNENPFGASPMALSALSHDMHLQKYPDGHCVGLRLAIARKFNLEEGRIVCGAGSDEIISLLCRAYLSPGDNVVYARHSFLMYGLSARASGADVIEVPEVNLTPDLDAMLKDVTPKTRIVFLTNPNNPTGSYNTATDIAEFRNKLRGDILLVLDDAYAEYAQSAKGYENGFALAKERADIVVMRTFSKIYGLAGLRLGYGYCPHDVASVLNRVRGPFNVSVPAQVAGIAALSDDTFLIKSVAHNNEWRGWLQDELTKMGLKVWPSAGNFLLVQFGTPQVAEATRLHLKSNGILVRQMGAYGLPDCLRISIGTGDELKTLIKALKS